MTSRSLPPDPSARHHDLFSDDELPHPSELNPALTMPAPPPTASILPGHGAEPELFDLDPALRMVEHGALGIDDPTLELRGGPVILIEHDPLLGRILAGEKYEIDSLVGSGANGAVYKAQQLALRRDVAVKVLHPHFQADPDFGARFQREAMAASQLDHPNILRVLDFGQEPDGLSYIVMELLNGQTLREVLDAEQKLSPERAVSIVSQVLMGLSRAHEAGIVHKDVKPDNVMIVQGRDEEGEPVVVAKVCDFGIAALGNAHPDEPMPALRTPGDLAKSTGGGYISGTPAYMSPEQVRGEPLDCRADLYACGCTLYEALTGRAPFEGTALDVLSHQVFTAPAPIMEVEPSVPPALADVIMRSIAKEKEQRPDSARQLRAALREAMESTVRAREAAARPPAPLREADEATLLSAFASSFTSAVLLASAGGPAFDAELARAWEAAVPLLSSAGEMSLVRRDTASGPGLFLLLGHGASRDLKSLMGDAYAIVGVPFLRELQRHELAMITLARGLSSASLAALVKALAGTENAAQLVASGAIAHVSALLPSQIVLRDRKLPWKVGLSLSRLAAEVSRIPAGTPTSTQVFADMAQWTDALVRKPEDVLAWFENVGAAVADRMFLAGLERAVVARIKERVAGDEQTPATFELLCDLGLRGLVATAELPQEAALVVRANLLARSLGRNHSHYLNALVAMEDGDGVQMELTVLKGALRVLAKRGETVPLLAAVQALARIARAKPEPERKERLALKVITAVVTEERLLPIANVVMLAQAHVREAGKQLLVLAGAPGVRALITARAVLREPHGRVHFVETLAGMGAHGSAEIAAALARVDLGKESLDTTAVEDLLQGVPVRPSTAVAAELPRFLRHAQLRAAAVHAAAAVSSPDAQKEARDALAHADPVIAASAAVTMARFFTVDLPVVDAAVRILEHPTAPESARTTAARALASTEAGAARGRALTVLSAKVGGEVGLLDKLRGAAPAPVDEPVLLATARSLLELDRNAGVSAITARAARAAPPLAQRLQDLITQTAPKPFVPKAPKPGS